MLLSSQVQKTHDGLLDDMVARFVEALSPVRVILFGSRAMGREEPDSDYDILIVAETDQLLSDRIARARRAVSDLPVAKDLFVVTPAEFETYAKWRSGIIREAAENGRVLYEAA
jgi:uncharacterized protein